MVPQSTGSFLAPTLPWKIMWGAPTWHIDMASNHIRHYMHAWYIHACMENWKRLKKKKKKRKRISPTHTHIENPKRQGFYRFHTGILTHLLRSFSANPSLSAPPANDLYSKTLFSSPLSCPKPRATHRSCHLRRKFFFLKRGTICFFYYRFNLSLSHAICS